MESFLGEIRMFAGNFAPLSWAFCHGQMLSISENEALFSILGTTYGGDGESNFALPDFRGRLPAGVGSGRGLTPKALGEKDGWETVLLATPQIPAHVHVPLASRDGANQPAPSGNTLGVSPEMPIYSSGPANTSLRREVVGPVGGNQQHDNMQPYQGINFIICLHGIFPSRG
jgi:microcystin-dependent protein